MVCELCMWATDRQTDRQTRSFHHNPELVSKVVATFETNSGFCRRQQRRNRDSNQQAEAGQPKKGSTAIALPPHCGKNPGFFSCRQHVNQLDNADDHWEGGAAINKQEGERDRIVLASSFVVRLFMENTKNHTLAGSSHFEHLSFYVSVLGSMLGVVRGPFFDDLVPNSCGYSTRTRL